MRRRRFLGSLAGITTSGTSLFSESKPSSSRIVSSRPGPSVFSRAYRITFGVHDTEPRPWDGQLLAEEGKFQIVADRFRANEYREVGFSARGFETKALGESSVPNDFVRTPTSWICSSRNAPLHGPTTEWHVRTEQPRPVIESPSILVHQLVEGNDAVRVETAQGEFSFSPETILPFEPALFLDGKVQVEYVPPTTPVCPQQYDQQDFPAVMATGADVWVAWQAYDGEFDSIFVQRCANGAWQPISVLAEKSDVFRVVLGKDWRGRIWAVWSMNAGGTWDLYGRVFEDQGWTPARKLTHHAAPEVYHQLVTDSTGRLWLVWQRNGERSQILAKYFDGHAWSEEALVSSGVSEGGNNWWPAVAAGPEGSIVVAWDGYSLGSYDVYLRRFERGQWRAVEIVAGGPRFQAHPTVAVEKTGRIWLAWDESEADWGKDVGFLVPHQATSLHQSRSIEVMCLDGDQRMSTAMPLSTALSPEDFWELPHLQLDADGQPWLFLRHMTMRQPDTPLEGPIDLALWEIYAARYDGSKWKGPIRLPHSTGRNDTLPSSTVDSEGNLWMTYATDHRSVKSFAPRQSQIQILKFPHLASVAPAELKPLVAAPPPAVRLNPQEAEEVKRIREYRIAHRGKTYRIFRGDLHRHTDISMDGNNDGTLLDAYRYARDAAALDFLGVSDHNNYSELPYNWWLTQKFADLFEMRGVFAAFYGYERSVEYPNGHRNIFFTKRGRQITPILEAEELGWEGSEGLFCYLRSVDGFSIPHTTGRTSGTDWRDNDPAVENVVELYQGMRDTYEYPGSPRPFRLWTEWLDPSQPIPRASSSENSLSFRRQGFVSNALAKGLKLGFTASSDHISAHISYACLIAEELSRDGLLEAIRARRTYAATDNIVLSVVFHGSDGEHLMGEKFSSRDPVRIKAHIYGTDAIQQVDIMKNGKTAHTLHPNLQQVEFEYVDENIAPGESYCYVRVIQKNGQMAWGSPAWVTYAG